jgi:hypothetical protein
MHSDTLESVYVFSRHFHVTMGFVNMLYNLLICGLRYTRFINDNPRLNYAKAIDVMGRNL